MPEDLKLSQIGSSPLPPPFRGHHFPGVRKHCHIIFACYIRKSSIETSFLSVPCLSIHTLPVPLNLTPPPSQLRIHSFPLKLSLSARLQFIIIITHERFKRTLFIRNGWRTAGEVSKIEQISGNVLTYTTKHKEQLHTSDFDRKSSSGVRR